MKLESLKLHNFQAHEDLEVKFSPTITTIKGATDSGKSAILRALRWVCLNDTAGADFITEGKKRAEVTLEISYGLPPAKLISTIIRNKNKDGNTNTYTLDGKEFKAFGQGVPLDIEKVLALRDINFQGQHDSPFWFSETAGEVSRKLNSVIDLEIIDTTLANIATEVRRAMERKSLCEERLAEAKRQLEELAPQKDRIDEFQNVKGKQIALKSITEDFNKLGDIAWRVSANKARTLKLQAEDGSALLATMLAARRAERASFALDQLIASTQLANKLAVVPPDFSPVAQAFTEYRAQTEYADRLEKLVNLAFEKKRLVTYSLEQAQQAEVRFHAQVRGKVCPLCKQIIKPEKSEAEETASQVEGLHADDRDEV
jgi:DNA repair exonuclease SbcCD ATPase subunit